jgi:hypothetical protein
MNQPSHEPADEAASIRIPAPAEWGPRARMVAVSPGVEPDVILKGWSVLAGQPLI